MRGFRGQLAATFGSATGTKATKFLVLHHATACLGDILLSTSGSSSVSSTMRSLVGVTRHVDKSSWGSAEMETARVVDGI